MTLIDVILIEAEAVDYRNCKRVCDIDAESDLFQYIFHGLESRIIGGISIMKDIGSASLLQPSGFLIPYSECFFIERDRYC